MDLETQRFLAWWKEQALSSPEGIRIEKEYIVNENNIIELLWFIYLEEQYVETHLRRYVETCVGKEYPYDISPSVYGHQGCKTYLSKKVSYNTIGDLDSIIRRTEEEELPQLIRGLTEQK